MKNSLLATAVISALSACGGDTVNNFDPTVNNFNAFAEKFDTYKEVGFQEINPDDLPDTADMQGFFTGYQESYKNLFVGTARATADFKNKSLNGSAFNIAEYGDDGENPGCSTNLKDCSGTPIQDLVGSLIISGTIEGVKFNFSIDGTLSGVDPNDSALNADVALNGSGAFGTINDNLVAVGISEGSVVLTSNEEIFTESISGILYLEK